VKRVFDKYLATPDGFEKLLDKIVEDGLGRIGDTDVKVAGQADCSTTSRSSAELPCPPSNDGHGA
jgi:hypothetical protein